MFCRGDINNVILHRIMKQLRSEGVSGGHLAQPLVRWLLKISQEEALQLFSLGNLCQCSAAHTVQNFFLIVRQFLVFQFVPISSCLVTGHYWKEPHSIFFTPFLWIFGHTDDIPPEIFLSWAEQSQLSQPFFVGEMLQSSPLNNVICSLLDSLWYVHVSFIELDSGL